MNGPVPPDALDDSQRRAEAAESVRARYEQHGPVAYYRQHAAGAYVNPHEPEVVQSLEMAAAKWSLDLTNVLDLAAGSGEATLALRRLGAGRVDGCDPYLFDLY